MYVHIYILLYIPIYKYMYVSTYTYINIYMYKYTYVHRRSVQKNPAIVNITRMVLVTWM